MKGFTQKIVQMMKNEKLFASQGGPIILSQVYFQVPVTMFKKMELLQNSFKVGSEKSDIGSLF